VPEELNLDVPFNSHGLDRLLKVDIPDNLHLTSLYLVKPPHSQAALNSVDVFNQHGEDTRHTSKAMNNNNFGDIFGDSSSGVSSTGEWDYCLLLLPIRMIWTTVSTFHLKFCS
jgi:hypothetical protein